MHGLIHCPIVQLRKEKDDMMGVNGLFYFPPLSLTLHWSVFLALKEMAGHINSHYKIYVCVSVYLKTVVPEKPPDMDTQSEF